MRCFTFELIEKRTLFSENVQITTKVSFHISNFQLIHVVSDVGEKLRNL
jgi:hypothetical protein